jgi:MFS family permease
MYAGMFLLPLHYQQLHGETVLHAGLLLIPQGVGSLAARFAVGKLVARLGARLVTMASFLLAAVATVPFALTGPHTSLRPLGAVLVIRGFGVGTGRASAGDWHAADPNVRWSQAELSRQREYGHGQDPGQ